MEAQSGRDYMYYLGCLSCTRIILFSSVNYHCFPSHII